MEASRPPKALPYRNLSEVNNVLPPLSRIFFFSPPICLLPPFLKFISCEISPGSRETSSFHLSLGGSERLRSSETSPLVSLPALLPFTSSETSRPSSRLVPRNKERSPPHLLADSKIEPFWCRTGGRFFLFFAGRMCGFPSLSNRFFLACRGVHRRTNPPDTLLPPPLGILEDGLLLCPRIQAYPPPFSKTWFSRDRFSSRMGDTRSLAPEFLEFSGVINVPK